jgi:serine protease Do
VLFVVLCVALVRGGGAASAAEDLNLAEQAALEAAADRVAPAMVRIETVGGLEQVGQVLFGTGPTTGLVVDKDGFILSSAFNFINKPSSILVHLPDGARKPARLVATDHNRMLALLKIDVDKPLPVPAMANDRPKVGQWAVALGRAFDAPRPNLAVGIISAVNRIWGKAIQTDAGVSPNNYGGPLVNLQGEVLGLLVPMSPEGNDEVAGVEWYDSGIGFAIPSEDLRAIVPRLKEGKDLRPGLAGFRFQSENLYTSEPVVGGCRPNSPAAKAGLQEGDRIVEVSGHTTDRAAQVKEQTSRHYAGETVTLVVLRGKERLEKKVFLVEKLELYETPYLGILPMRPARPEAKEKQEKPQDVVVRHVLNDSPAAKAGIQRGDTVVSLAGKAVRNADELRRRIADCPPDQNVELEIRRGRETKRMTAVLGRLPEAIPSGPLPSAIEPARPNPEASSQRSPRPPAGERPGVKVEASNEKQSTGMVRFDVGKFTNEVWAYIPEGYAASIPHGVVVWLHGPGGLDAKALIAEWKAVCDRDHLILVAPKAADPDHWTVKELSLVRGLLEQIQSRYTIDSSRVVLCGQGEGGKLAYLLAFLERKVVRAVAAIQSPLAGRPPENDPDHRLAFYVASASQGESAGEIRESTTRLREMKYPVSTKDLGEKPRPLNAEELAELARWIDTLDRI